MSSVSCTQLLQPSIRAGKALSPRTRQKIEIEYIIVIIIIMKMTDNLVDNDAKNNTPVILLTIGRVRIIRSTRLLGKYRVPKCWERRRESQIPYYLWCFQNCIKSAENGPSIQNKLVPNRCIGKSLRNCMTRNKDSLARQASGACPRKAWTSGTTVSSPTVDSERFGIVEPDQTEIGSSAGYSRDASNFRIAYGESQPGGSSRLRMC
jgi:hypothetical protein